MNRILCLLFAVVIFLFSACASAPVAKWRADDMNGISAYTEAQVIEKFGQPDRKTKSLRGEVFEYRKPSEKDSGKNMYAAVTTFGIVSGKDSLYLDILKITLSNGVVADCTYEEGVMGVALPGSGK